MTSNYQSLVDQGFTDEELISHLSKKYNDPQIFEKYTAAIEQNFTPQEYFDAYIKKRKAKPEESKSKSALRYAAQIPLGIAEMTKPGILSNIINLIGTGEALDPEEIEHIKNVSEREGIPFDEEKYLEAVNTASRTFPTVSNIARMVEEKTDIPLEAKTKGQKLLKFASSAGKGTPGTITQKIVGGTTGAATKEVLDQIGIPEFISDVVGFGTSAKIGSKSPKFEINVEKAKKPSGLSERRFEGLTKPRKISESNLNSINSAVENDFRELSNKIIEESPVGETAKKLKENPTYKNESSKLLSEAQELANNIEGKVNKKAIIDEYATISNKTKKGFMDNDYEENYSKYMNEAIGKIKKHTTFSQLVEQYRKNNSQLSESFDPTISKPANRAKKDALLDQNRAIAKIIKEKSPDPEFSNIFEEGNNRWSKIMDVEALDNIVDDLFSGKINFKKANKVLESDKYGHILKRSLGEKGYNEFTSLLEDLSSTEKAYKMLQVAKSKGFSNLFSTASAYFISPKLGHTKTLFDTSKFLFRKIMNSSLSKPQYRLTLKKGIDSLKKGDFTLAEQIFSELENM